MEGNKMITKSYHIEVGLYDGLYYIVEDGLNLYVSEGYKTEEEARESIERVCWGESPLRPRE